MGELEVAVQWIVMTSGWLVGAFFAGLWISSQQWVQRIEWRPTRPKVSASEVPKVVANPPSVEDDALGRMMAVDRERWITDLMADAKCSREKAEEQVDTTLAELGLR